MRDQAPDRAPYRDPYRDPYLQALAIDDTLPIDPEAKRLWLDDLQNPLRWTVLPVLQATFACVLHVTWLLKRLSPIDVRAPRLLQALICWFCEHFVSPEANVLILRHFATESNLLNFLIDNTPGANVEPVDLYPETVAAMHQASFVDHDQELFRTIRELGSWTRPEVGALRWDHWRDLQIDPAVGRRKLLRILDFETAHVLFMSLFCLLLTKREYQAAINGFSLDHSIAFRIAHLIGDPTVPELAYNKHPLYLVGPWNLTQRFLMLGFFTEYVHARLLQLRP